MVFPLRPPCRHSFSARSNNIFFLARTRKKLEGEWHENKCCSEVWNWIFFTRCHHSHQVVSRCSFFTRNKFRGLKSSVSTEEGTQWLISDGLWSFQVPENTFEKLFLNYVSNDRGTKNKPNTYTKSLVNTNFTNTHFQKNLLWSRNSFTNTHFSSCCIN